MPLVCNVVSQSLKHMLTAFSDSWAFPIAARGSAGKYIFDVVERMLDEPQAVGDVLKCYLGKLM